MFNTKAAAHNALFRSRLVYDARVIRTVLSTVVVMSMLYFVTQPADGAPMVVKQLLYDDGGQQFMELPTSLPFSFHIYEPRVFPTPVYATWLENYSPADVGKSFFAPPEVVAGATAARSSTTALAVLEVNFGSFHSTPEPWWLGFPMDHYITAIERVVDNLVITPISQNRYTVQFAQRVRIWAEPVPEPCTIALCAIAVWYGCSYRLMAFGRRRPRFRLLHSPKLAES